MSNDQQDEKVATLMRMFEEERVRHREAELAAETRIRVLENKLKQVNESSPPAKTNTKNASSTPTARRLHAHNNNNNNNNATSSTNGAAGKKTPVRTTTPTSKKQLQGTSKTREMATGVEARTSDSLFATPTKRRNFSTTPLTPTANLKKVQGSPTGSPSGVSTLPRASSATTSRSERLAAARTKRKEEQNNNKESNNSAKSNTTATTDKNNKNVRRASSTPTTSTSNNKPKSASSIASGPNPEHEKCWKKFCDAATGQFSSSELVAVSNETLQQLMDHFSINDPVERARVEAHWAFLNETKAGRNIKSATNNNNNRTTSANSRNGASTPHRKRVKDLHFPDHADDFNLRTTVPPDANLSSRKSLGPGDLTPRGCNIDAHHFGCPERKMRSLALLRTRSPATGNYGESAVEHSPQALRKSKKIIDCDAKKTNNDAAKLESKKFFSSVPGEEAVDRAEGKRRASAIPGTKINSDEEKQFSKKMDVPRPRTEEESRRGIKIHVNDPANSKDARRYTRQQNAANVFHPVADATLSTITLERLGNHTNSNGSNHNNNNNNNRPARSLLNSCNAAAPTKYQLKTPFAVDG